MPFPFHWIWPDAGNVFCCSSAGPRVFDVRHCGMLWHGLVIKSIVFYLILLISGMRFFSYLPDFRYFASGKIPEIRLKNWRLLISFVYLHAISGNFGCAQSYVCDTYLNCNSGSAKLPLKLGYGWVIASHCSMWTWLLIHALISVLV